MPALVFRRVAKSYGKKPALRGVSFAVGEGEVYGLVGPNGAGKTTALRVAATLLKPDEGEVLVCGVDALKHSHEVRRFVAYVPEEAGAYPYMTGWEYLELMARLYRPGDYESVAREAAELSGLGAALKDKVKTYSKGMKRRLQLARALAVKPKLAILDEPTSGLDVSFSIEMREQIRAYAKEHGVSVLMSSHNMLEVERTCDRVGVLHSGLLLAEGSPSDLVSRYGASSLEEVFKAVVRGGSAPAG